MANGHLKGRHGIKKVADTNLHTASDDGLDAYGLGIVITDAVFASGTTVHYGDVPDTTATHSAGTPIRTMFKTVKLTSGIIYFDRVPDLANYFD